MRTITLPFDWSEARKSPDRYVYSLEGIKVDLLTLAKVDLNKKLDHDGRQIHFKEEQVVKGESSMSLDDYLKSKPLRLIGVGNYKSHCVIHRFHSKEELFDVSFTDNFLNTNVVKKTSLRTYGYSQDELLDLMESVGAIKRACKDAFIVISREGFYAWMGEPFMTGELFFEHLKKALNKKG